jgi:hypothetical protein
MGALGPVFRAQGNAPGQLVAIKAFKLDVSPELAPSIAASLRDLVGRTSAVAGLVPLVDAGLEGDTPWLAMDHLAWPTLDTRLREGRLLPLAEAMSVVRALAHAVDLAHGEDLLHGSLHPRDVFLAPVGGIALSGFGVAAALGVAGLRPPRRRPFTAPELLAQKPLAAPADRYALGVLAYEIVSGRRLLGASDDLVAGLAARAETSDVSRAATAFAAMLAERPDHRPSSAGAFAQALCAALEAPPPTAGTSAVPAVSHSPVIAVIPPASRSRVADGPPPAEALAEFARQGTFWEPPRHDVDDDAATVVAAPRPVPLEDEATQAVRPAPVDPDPPAVDPPPATEPHAWDQMPAVAVPAPAPTILDVPLHPEAARAETGDTLLFRSFGDPAADRPVAPTPTPAPDPGAHTPPLVVLALTLGLGLAVGGAGGYLLGVRSGERAAQRALGGDTGFVDAPAAAPATPAGDVAAAPVDTPAAPATPPRTAAGTEAAAGTPRPAPPAATGQLAVRSTPTRAGVVVDGTWRGRTPLTVRGLTPGTHAVRVVQDGYVAETRRVTVDARSGPTTVSFQLERVRAPERPAAAAARPAAKTGALRFDSRPSGAAVFLDGRLLGTTPLQVSDLEPRAYGVRLELAGHRVWTTTSTVVAGQQVRVAASLEESN